MIPSRELEDYVLLAVERYVALLHTLEVRLPIVVTLALFGVAGYDFAVQPPYRNYDPTPIDRDLLRLPDVLVHDYENGVAKAIRPIFDALWNAGGYAQCMNYDENDDRKPRQ